MGRWAQAQRRGTAKTAVSPALGPWTSDFDIGEASTSGADVLCNITGGDAGYAYWQVEAYSTVVNDPEDSDPTLVSEDASVNGIPGAGLGLAAAKARFVDSLGNALTEWSAVQTVAWGV